jgi:ketosteroid isomerase-like protein
MSRSLSVVIVAGCSACIALAACAPAPNRAESQSTSGIDSLNARVVDAYRKHDPEAYGALYTDTAVFEWPAFNTVRGRAGLAAMARDNWGSLRDMDLVLTVASRRLGADQATEFGAFQQSWTDSAGTRMTEYGRYVTVLARQEDGSWLMDRFFGFEDSTRAASPPSAAAKR